MCYQFSVSILPIFSKENLKCLISRSFSLPGISFELYSIKLDVIWPLFFVVKKYQTTIKKKNISNSFLPRSSWNTGKYIFLNLSINYFSIPALLREQHWENLSRKSISFSSGESPPSYFPLRFMTVSPGNHHRQHSGTLDRGILRSTGQAGKSIVLEEVVRKENTFFLFYYRLAGNSPLRQRDGANVKSHHF